MSKIIIHEGTSFNAAWVASHKKEAFLERGNVLFFQALSPEARHEALEAVFRKSGGEEDTESGTSGKKTRKPKG